MTTAYVDPQTLHNPAAGNKPPATWGDTVRDDLEFLIAPPMCRVYRSADQTGLTTGAWTAVTFPTGSATEAWDTDAFHSLSTNTSRLTIPTGLGGRYLLTGCAVWDSNTTGNRALTFYKGGSTPVGVQTTITANSEGSMISIAAEVALAAGEYVEMKAYQSSGANRDLKYYAADHSISFSLRWVSR